MKLIKWTLSESDFPRTQCNSSKKSGSQKQKDHMIKQQFQESKDKVELLSIMVNSLTPNCKNRHIQYMAEWVPSASEEVLFEIWTKRDTTSNAARKLILWRTSSSFEWSASAVSKSVKNAKKIGSMSFFVLTKCKMLQHESTHRSEFRTFFQLSSKEHFSAELTH